MAATTTTKKKRTGAVKKKKATKTRKRTSTRAPSGEGEAGGPAPSTDYATKLRDHRTRQTSVAAILDNTFGPLAECNPDLWGRRAYLMLVGLVYERLGAHELEIPTEELVALAKVLAEHRRAEQREPDGAAVGNGKSDAAKRAVNGSLPDRIHDVVRQLYGTDFPTEGTETATESPRKLNTD